MLGTIVPFSAFLVALHHIAPTNATVTSTVEPVIAAVGAFLLFGETLTAIQVVGGLMVIAAIAVIQIPEKSPVPTLPPPD